MADYYLAPSLISLRNEINAAHPNRDKTSDGWIGDSSHAARKSDHNPDWDDDGVVRALDVDHDGIDKVKLRQVAAADPRTEYIIQDWKIYTRANGFRAQKYTGTNGHTAHTHISLRHTASAQKSGRWGYAASVAAAPAPAPARPAGAPLPLDQVARQVVAGSWGNGDDRMRRLRAAGYDPVAVQNEVNRQVTKAPAPARKSMDQLVDEVFAGKWGNGPDRSRRLQAAGYSPSEVQNAVNARVGTNVAVRPSLEVIADQVIKNQWGNGLERRRRLTAAGYNYAEVQAEVNRRLR